MTTTPQRQKIGNDMKITRRSRRAAGSGTWVLGQLNGHRFEALVFPEHAENSDWELQRSRISKLYVERLSDQRQVFNWDRGLDVAAANETAQAIVDFLAKCLADLTYPI